MCMFIYVLKHNYYNNHASTKETSIIVMLLYWYSDAEFQREPFLQDASIWNRMSTSDCPPQTCPCDDLHRVESATGAEVEGSDIVDCRDTDGL